MLGHGGRDISGPFLSQSSHSEPQQQRSCWWVFTLIVSDSLRNSRAGSRTIYQHGADVNVLFERRVAVVNTQSQHRSRKKWRIDTTTCARAIGGRTGALISKNIDRTVTFLHNVNFKFVILITRRETVNFKSS